MQNHKKANIEDIGTALGLLLGIVFTLFIVWVVIEGFKTNIASNTAFDDTQRAYYASHETKFLRAWDIGFMLLLVLLPIVSYYWATKIPSDTIFMIIFIVVHLAILIGAMVISNVYGALMDNTTFQSFASTLKIIPFVMPKLIYWVMIYTILVLVGLYGKENT